MHLEDILGYGTLFAGTNVQAFFMTILSLFIGLWSSCRVSHSFHAPLMGLTNAISSIVIFVALACVKGPLTQSGWLYWVNMSVIFLLSVNIFGGLMITGRMLSLFFTKNKS